MKFTHTLTLCSIFFFSFTLISTAQNEIQQERMSLQGINRLGFIVNLETNVSLNDKGELEITSIEEAVKIALRKSNIPLVNDREIKSSRDLPFLYMHINTMDAGRGLVPFSISLRFYQPVKLLLNRDLQSSASTWETGMVGIVSYDQMEVIQESALNLLQDFIDDYKLINN